MSELTYLRRLVAARSRASSKGLTAESLTLESLGEAPEPPQTDDVMQRVHDVMTKMPPGEIPNPDDFRTALTIFERHAHRTLLKLDRDPGAPLDRGEQNALEAVVRTDGTRPTLLVRNDTINPEHPLAGSWKNTLFNVRDTMRKRAAAVGRLEPANGSPTRFFGTGWVVDQAKGLVLTNLHVLHAMLASVPNAMLWNGERFRVLPNAVFIDFAAEDGALAKKRFRVVEVTPSGVDGPGFDRLDAAVAKIEPLDGAAALPMPESIPVVADLAGPTGAMASFCVIGFPGRPEITSGIVDGVNWDWITQTLFGNRFGLKRIAPGIAHKPLGQIAGDAQPWVFGHDATTLGGSSGSPVLAWLDQGFSGFGLHFAGATEDKNFAHALAQCRDRLQTLGVPVKDPS